MSGQEYEKGSQAKRNRPVTIDKDPRAVYFDLIKYGQFLRMGLLCHVLRVSVD